MFVARTEILLTSLYKQAITMCKESNSCVLILVNLMDKKEHWDPYLIDEVKGTFGLRRSSLSESNHVSVRNFVLEHTDGMHGAMYELMKRQKS